MRFLLTRFPYFFYLPMNETADIDFKNKIIKKTEFDEKNEVKEIREYSFEPLKSYIFLLIKYLPVAILLFFAYTKYDFILSKEKVIQYAVAFALAFLIAIYSRWVFLIISIALVVSSLFFIEDIAYILKYFFTFLMILSLILELDLQVFNVYKNANLIGQILIKKENNE